MSKRSQTTRTAPGLAIGPHMPSYFGGQTYRNAMPALYNSLTESKKMLFLNECAERVLFRTTSVGLNIDKRLIDAMIVARRYANGTIGFRRLYSMNEIASDAYEKARSALYCDMSGDPLVSDTGKASFILFMSTRRPLEWRDDGIQGQCVNLLGRKEEVRQLNHMLSLVEEMGMQ